MTLAPAEIRPGDNIVGGDAPAHGYVTTVERSGLWWRVAVRGCSPMLLAHSCRVEVER